MKQCIGCKETKDEFQFYKTKDNRLRSYCKPCEIKRAGDYKRTQKIQAIKYKGNSCSDCGGIFIPAVFHFHHTDPTTKEFSFNQNRSWEIVEKELDKCTLLCANCHIIRHAEERVAA